VASDARLATLEFVESADAALFAVLAALDARLDELFAALA